MHTETIKHERLSVTIQRCASWSSLIEQLEQPPVWKRDAASVSGRQSFAGSASYEAATKLARTGDAHGARLLIDGLHDLCPDQSLIKLDSVSYDVAGAMPDVAEYVSGNPCYMMLPGQDVVARNPVVSLIVNSSASCAVEVGTMRRYGAAVLTLIVNLERSGYAVELETAQCVTGSNNAALCQRVTVKRACEPLDVERVAYAVTHPSYLRRSMFRLYECDAALERDFGRAYGYPTGIASILPKSLIGSDTVIVPPLQSLKNHHDARLLYDQIESSWRSDWKEEISFDFDAINSASGRL